MYKEEINRINEHYQKRIGKLGQYITFEDLNALDLHPAILRYISAEIDYLIYEDREKLLHNSAFNYSSEKIKYFFSLIAAEIRKEKRFSAEYISKLILHGVSFNIHHLVKPNWALTKFIFENEEKKPVKEIEQILSYIYHYPYSSRVIISYLKKKNFAVISITDFKNLLLRIDSLAIEDFRTNIIETAIKSMNDFFNIGLPESKGVHIKALKLFFEEKNLTDDLNLLNSNYPDENQWAPSNNLLKLYGLEIDLQEEISKEEAELRASMEAIKKGIIGSEKEIAPENDLDYEEFIEKEIEHEIEEKFDEIEKTEVVETEKDISEETTDGETIDSVSTEKTDDTPLAAVEDELSIEKTNDENPEIDEEPEIKASPEIEKETESNESIEEETQQDRIEEDIEELIISDEEEIQFVEEESFLENEENSSEEEFTEELFPPEEVLGNNADEVDFIEDETEIDTSSETVDDENIHRKYETTDDEKKIDVAKLIENKNMSKLIESVFDYDMQEFTSVVEELSSCKSLDEANTKLERIFERYKIDPNSKEGNTFKEVLSDYFKEG